MKMSLDDCENENDRIQLLFVEAYSLHSVADPITKHVERDSPLHFDPTLLTCTTKQSMYMSPGLVP